MLLDFAARQRRNPSRLPARPRAPGADVRSTKLSIVIGSFERHHYLRLAIESVRAELLACGLPAEIIVVDGGSQDGSVEWLAKQKDVITIVQHNRGTWRNKPVERRSWGYFMNLGFKIAQGTYVCMLSDDCLLVPGALARGVAAFDTRRAAGEKVGAMAFWWRNWPGQKDYWIGLTFGGRMFVNHGLYLRTALEEIGFADEETYSFYHADGDVCLRLWEKGYACVEAAGSYVEHHAHANQKVRAGNLVRQKEDWGKYVARWGHLGTPEQDWLVRPFDDPARTADRFKRGWVARLRG